MYYGLDLSRKLKGWSWLDLGCNEGSVALLAAQDGAHPVVGVELNDNALRRARRRVAESGLDVQIAHADILDYVEDVDRFDVVSLFAMLRHVHRGLMVRQGYAITPQGRAYLIYDSFRTLIKGEDSPVKEQMDEFLATCLAKARRYFICSIDDHSGLILRRSRDVTNYFKNLSDRVYEVEVYPLPQNPEYVIIQIPLTCPST